MGELPDDLGPIDVIIVGAGVNGAVLAAELDLLRLRVLVLEAGGDTGADEQLTAEVGSARFEGATAGRRRGFGGSGSWWAGQCAPFDPLDFEERPWVPSSGWPLSFGDIEPWYHRAADVLGIPNERFDDEQWKRRRVVPVHLDGLDHKFSAFIPRPDIAAELRSRFASSAHTVVALRAPVLEVVPRDDHSRVGGVVIGTLAGQRRFIAATCVVLASGGIETPRLLLASRSTTSAGLGNSSDQVGRYLHDHPNGLAAEVRPRDPRRMQDLYGMLYAGKVRHWARIPLPERVQRDEQLVNATANVVFSYPDDGPVESLKRIVREQIQRRPLERRPGPGEALRDVTRALPAVPSVLWRRYGRGLSPVQPAAKVWLQTAAEQPPRPESRVTLSSREDERGMPLARINWVLGEEERRAQAVLVREIARAWESAGLAIVEPLPWLTSDREEWRSHQVDAYHHSGTTRMSSSAASGVVDEHQECHELPGLFIAGSSVFPTSSHWNPTFTSVALTLRLASHLGEVLR